MGTHLAREQGKVSFGGEMGWGHVWAGARRGAELGWRVGVGAFHCSQGSGNLPGPEQAPTVPGLVKPHSCPQAGSLSPGQACCRSPYRGRRRGNKTTSRPSPQLNVEVGPSGEVW